MKIVVVNSYVPFVHDAKLFKSKTLQEALRLRSDKSPFQVLKDDLFLTLLVGPSRSDACPKPLQFNTTDGVLITRQHKRVHTADSKRCCSAFINSLKWHLAKRTLWDHEAQDELMTLCLQHFYFILLTSN